MNAHAYFPVASHTSRIRAISRKAAKPQSKVASNTNKLFASLRLCVKPALMLAYFVAADPPEAVTKTVGRRKRLPHFGLGINRRLHVLGKFGIGHRRIAELLSIM